MTCFCGFSGSFPMCDNTHMISRIVKDQVIKRISLYFENNDNPKLDEVIDVIKKTKGINIQP